MTGRPATPNEVLKLHGTYRKDRHGERGPTTGGEPLRKPDDLDPAASWLWDEITRTRSPWLCSSDAAALRTLCDAWGLMQAVKPKLIEDPTDKNARCAWSAYQSVFKSLAACFGITPSDRARLGEDKPTNDADRAILEMLQ